MTSGQRLWDHVYTRRRGWDLVERDCNPGTAFSSAVPASVRQRIDPLKPGMRVLQPFCGDGVEIAAMANMGCLAVGVDWSEVALRVAHEECRSRGWVVPHLLQTDLNGGFPLATSAFDLCWLSMGSLCWVHDLRAFFFECSRALRRGGRVVIHDIHPISQIVSTSGNTLRPSLRAYPESGAPSKKEVRLGYLGIDLIDSAQSTIHALGDIVTCASAVGFEGLELLEFSWTTFRQFPWLRREAGELWVPGDSCDFRPPLSFCMSARKG